VRAILSSLVLAAAVAASHTPITCSADFRTTTIDRHRLDDFRSYVFATRDYGRTWTDLSPGLTGYAHAVLEDPKQPNLLYAGTELGMFASFDRGASWTDLRLGLPHLAVVEMKVHPRDNDLVIATHARGFYILDDATPLQQLAAGGGTAPSEAVLFPPSRATRYTPASDTSVLGNRVWVARNKPYGSIISYYLPAAASAAPAISVIDSAGRTVRTLQGPAGVGINRVVWNLAETSACPETGGRGRGGRGGANPDVSWIRALPGAYTVSLTTNGRSWEQPLTVRLDPRLSATADDLRVYQQTVRTIEGIECSVASANNRIDALERQLARFDAETSPAAVKAEAAAIRAALKPLAADFAGDPREPDRLNLRGKMNWFTIQVGNYSGRPTLAQVEWIDKFAAERDRLNAALDELESRTTSLERR